MKINIGTKNQVKIEALRKTIAGYDFLKDAAVIGAETDSGVMEQPQDLATTVRGAQNRARNSFKECDMSVGIEDGLMAIPASLTGSMNVTAAAFYDGKRFYLGLSAAFEYPPGVMKLVAEGLDINQAFHRFGLTDDPKIGSSRGAVGILTKDRWRREDTAKQALTSALIQLENKSLYE